MDNTFTKIYHFDRGISCTRGTPFEGGTIPDTPSILEDQHGISYHSW